MAGLKISNLMNAVALPRKAHSQFSISVDEKTHAARLLHVLAEGEQVASTIALEQAKLCRHSEHPRLAKFLKHQSRQEKFHQFAFERGANWLAPKEHSGYRPVFTELENKLKEDIQNQDMTSSVVGLQVALEALGDAFLETLSARMEKRAMGLDSVMHLIIHQEIAHQNFGKRYLTKYADRQDISLITADYMQIIDSAISTFQTSLYAIDIDDIPYRVAVSRELRRAARVIS